MVEDIQICSNRGFLDLDGQPLSIPDFMKNIDSALLLECVKDDDMPRYLNKLGISTSDHLGEISMIQSVTDGLDKIEIESEETGRNKGRLSLLEMTNGS